MKRKVNQEMAYFEKCERFEKDNQALREALNKLLTEASAIHGDDLADSRTIEQARAALTLTKNKARP